MERELEPEILDDLDPADPRAVASRRDLGRINFLMGNERWLLREVGKRPQAAARGIVEWGAGQGHLLKRLASFGPATGIDRVARPADLPGEIAWHAGDLLDSGERAAVPGGLVVVNLLLHHFEAEDLRRLGELARPAAAIICVEPWRHPVAMTMGKSMLPWVSEVTRHDMLVSIRAGFDAGELAAMLGLAADWKIKETTSLRGGLRSVMERNRMAAMG
mgnify:FL=1